MEISKSRLSSFPRKNLSYTDEMNLTASPYTVSASASFFSLNTISRPLSGDSLNVLPR